MRYVGRLAWYVGAMVLTAIVGQQWQLTTFSVMPWPLFASGLFTFLPLRSWRLVLSLGMLAELVSGLPPGMMTVIVCLPWVLSWWARRPAPAFSVGFLLWVMLVGAVQYVVLAVWAWFWQGYDVPVVVPVMWAATGVAVFLATVAWYEYIEPYRRGRTQPRFKHV